MAITDRGELLLGAKPIAAYALKDEKKWKKIYNPRLQAELGLFDLAGRVAGYTGIIDARLNAKVNAALAAMPDQKSA
jgi:hypothetical protein